MVLSTRDLDATPMTFLRGKSGVPFIALLVILVGCAGESEPPCEGGACAASDDELGRPCTKKKPCPDGGGGGTDAGGTLDAGTGTSDSGTTDSGPSTPPPDSGAGASGAWPPSPTNTGVPAGTTLTSYTGPCTITTPNTVISEKLVDCGGQLRIETTGVLIQRSKVVGGVSVGEHGSDPEGDDPLRVTVIDSELIGTDTMRPIGSSHFRVVGSYLHGSYSGGDCHNACSIERSYLVASSNHTSGLRVLRNAKIIDSTIWCKPFPTGYEDGGCSADLVMYEEFGMPQNVRAEHNFFKATSAYFAIRQDGGNAGGLVFTNNVFEKGESGTCGRAAPTMEFEAAGNTYTANEYDDGTPVIFED